MNAQLNSVNKMFLTMILITITSIGLHGASNTILVQEDSTSTQDTLVISNDTEPLKEKNYLIPALEVLGTNLAVWSYHKFFTGEDWADIDFHTIKHNFEVGFKWDSDGFPMNQFLHPYHGAAYFNSARSNGLEFWESAPYPVFGSLMWEYLMENEAPSYNDIVNTPVSGIIIGEISYRVSNLVIDESTIGIERFGREFLALLINPVQGFNRFVSGAMWRDGLPHKQQKFKSSFSLGNHSVFLNRSLSRIQSFVLIGFDMEHGDKFETTKHDRPFDYFTLHSELNIAEGDNIIGLSASGVLWDWKVDLLGINNNVFGIYKELDVFINMVYKLSATSVSVQLANRTSISSSVTLQSSIGISGVLMGATDSKYTADIGKDYNQGPGAGAKTSLQLFLKNRSMLYINYKRFWIHTLSGVDSEEFVGILNVGINHKIFDNFSVGADLILYERYGEYDNYPDTQTSNAATRIYLKYFL